jgi:hypothetical protein
VQSAAPPGGWPTLRELARGPGKLPPPLGKSLPENRGAEFKRYLRWGVGDDNAPWSDQVPAAIVRIDSLTRAELEGLRITADEAILWAHAYEVEAEMSDHANLSAGPRAALMRCIAKILQNLSPLATSLDCCAEERAWRHPPNIQRRQ